MKHLLIAALLLSPLPAFAEDSITITVVAGAGGGQTTQVWTMTPEEAAKFQAFVHGTYGCVAPPGQECEQFTNDQMVGMWASATLQGTIDNVNRAAAAKAAGDAVSGITPIPPAPPTDQTTVTKSKSKKK